MIFAFVLITIVSFTSCATLINGRDQKVTIVSEPAGAIALVDGKEVGSTPVVVTLPRKEDHLVTVSKEGYQEEDADVKRKLSGVTLLYLLPGGSLGLLADAASGNGSQYSFPDTLRVSLHPTHSPRGLMSKQLRIMKSVTKKLVQIKTKATLKKA